MNHDLYRLQTFENWPADAAVSPEQIARAGFLYTNEEMMVECFACRVRVSAAQWQSDDNIVNKHFLANSNCPFVNNLMGSPSVPMIESSGTSNVSISNSGEVSEVSSSLAHRMYPDLDLTRYSNRLLTFQNWPVTEIVSPERLARAGFIYLQESDMVECVYCRGVVLKWEPGDDPDRDHRVHFPNCDFYLKQDEDEDLSAEKVELGNVKLMPGTTSNFLELGIQHHSAPRQPKYATYDSRLRTFTGWPSDLKQTPEMLADAGFYYVGSLDQVRCFHCDGGLRNWEETDDAWIEHAKWFPKCGYVNLVKGQDFIQQCARNRPPLDPSILSGTPDENQDTPTDTALQIQSPTTERPQNIVRQVSDAELEELLGTEPAMAALQIGIHVGRIKLALKRRMELTGIPYSNADQLIEDATRIQLGEEDNIMNGQMPPSPTELTHLINRMLASVGAANSSTSTQTERMIEGEKEQNNVPQEGSSSTVLDEPDDKTEKTQENSKTNKSTASLQEENRRLREARMCKICMDREIAVVFLPCGHLSTCVFCAPSLTHCPMCRQEIRATVRTFLA